MYFRFFSLCPHPSVEGRKCSFQGSLQNCLCSRTFRSCSFCQKCDENMRFFFSESTSLTKLLHFPPPCSLSVIKKTKTFSLGKVYIIRHSTVNMVPVSNQLVSVGFAWSCSNTILVLIRQTQKVAILIEFCLYFVCLSLTC